MCAFCGVNVSQLRLRQETHVGAERAWGHAMRADNGPAATAGALNDGLYSADHGGGGPKESRERVYAAKGFALTITPSRARALQ